MPEANSKVAARSPSADLVLQLLAWIAVRPRSYAETMEAWRTSCPRLSVWEDATSGGLVRLEAGAVGETRVTLTKAGKAALTAAGQEQAGRR